MRAFGDMRRWAGLVGFGAGALTALGVARADVPPPEDYVEMCTLANHDDADSDCVTCDSGMPTPTDCAGRLSGEGYEKVCQTYGTSSFTEVWCRPASSEAPVDADVVDGVDVGGGGDAGEVTTTTTPEAPAASGGACSAGGASTALGLLGALLALGRRRR